MHVSLYLQACMIPNNHCTGPLFTAADVKFLLSVVCAMTTLLVLRSNFRKDKTLEPVSLVKVKSGKASGEPTLPER